MFTWTSYISQSAAQIGCTSSVKMNQAIKEVLFFYFFVAGSVIKKNKRESGFEKINNRLCKKAVFLPWQLEQCRSKVLLPLQTVWGQVMIQKTLYQTPFKAEGLLVCRGDVLAVQWRLAPRPHTMGSCPLRSLISFPPTLLFLNQVAFCSPAAVRSLVSPLLPTPTFYLIMKWVFWG